MKNNDVFEKFVAREAFRHTPKQRELPDVKRYLEGLPENLQRQEEVYREELKVFYTDQQTFSVGAI